MKIETLDKSLEEAYHAFILRFETASLFASLKYRNFLRDFLGARDCYLLASEAGEMKGVLPLFVKEHARHGAVFNSLPFYGSNGGAIASDPETKRLLLGRYREMLEEKNAVAGTLITAPFESDIELYEESDHRFKEMRIGQVTRFPETSDQLMNVFHSKTRNMVRKAAKMKVRVSWEGGLGFLDFLCETHRENMEKIGVSPKPKSFFELVQSKFDYGSDFRIYVAECGDGPIAALLSFYFNRTAEYFVPVTVERYRDHQPMSLIVYEAMKDALDAGFRFWNWGGTAPAQKGVYDFKKRWGTTDLEYFYYTILRSEKLKHLSRETLLAEFPYFFVLPFSALEAPA